MLARPPRLQTQLRRSLAEEPLVVRRDMTLAASPHAQGRCLPPRRSRGQTIDGMQGFLLVTIHTGDLAVYAHKRKRFGMLKFRNAAEGLFLSVARCTILPQGALMHIFVAARTFLVETLKTLLPLGQHFHFRERMALLAGNRQVFSGQLEREAGVIKVIGIGNTRQRETATIGEPKSPPVVFRVTFRTVLRKTTGQKTM